MNDQKKRGGSTIHVLPISIRSHHTSSSGFKFSLACPLFDWEESRSVILVTDDQSKGLSVAVSALHACHGVTLQLQSSPERYVVRT